MSFGFGNSGNTMGAGAPNAGASNPGPDLETIQTEVSASQQDMKTMKAY